MSSGKQYHFKKKYKILVVFEKSNNTQILVNLLNSYELDAFPAYNCETTMDKLLETQFDLVILDLDLQEKNGIEVCKSIREIFPVTILPVILLFTRKESFQISQALLAGANDYLIKPFFKNELIARLQVHLDLQESVKEQIEQIVSFERFVPSRFLNLLGYSSVSEVQLGESILKNMSVLFTDIRSFTTLSEKMTPQENFNFLNSYLKRMEPAINKNQGFVDKFIGDAIMALFEETNGSSADFSLTAALEMRKALDIFNRHRKSTGYQEIETGVGINYGPLVLGTVGSNNRLSTTVIGNTVNLAARLESLTSYYSARILISDYVCKALQKNKDIAMREIGSVAVKGKKDPVGVYEVYAADDDEVRQLKERSKGELTQGIIFYKIGEFKEAFQYFQAALEIYPNDRVASVYLQRCKDMSNIELPDNWQGVIAMDHK